MTTNLLLVTTDVGFSTSLLQGIEHEGYRLHVVKGKGEAVVKVDEENCSLALLDLDLGKHPVSDIGRAIRTVNPTIQLILFSDADTMPTLDELRPWVLLRKPHFLPELLKMLKDNNPSTPRPAHTADMSPAVHVNKDELPWLQDVTKAAQHLTRLTLESSAQAALITRKDSLWAYAGQLSQNAAKELAVTVTRHWDGQKGSDLLRFVRLEATKAEHMLYATRLADEVVLALVFDAETPFSTIRMQAGQLVNRLSTPGTTEAMDQPVAGQKQPPASIDSSTSYNDDDNADLDIPNISDILNDVPPPMPGMIPLTPEDQAETRVSKARPKKYSRESSPAMHREEMMSGQSNEQTVEHVV